MKKAIKPAVRRKLVNYAREENGASLHMACRAVGISDSVYQYQPDRLRDDAVIARLLEAVERHSAYGLDKLFKKHMNI